LKRKTRENAGMIGLLGGMKKETPKKQSRSIGITFEVEKLSKNPKSIL